ncbi:MAG: family 10 glycosylhydrolase, partial [Bacteroidetes bacterium]|nr:family 10 glycosylhydrolase [Bacteroidota bacterium]
MRPVLLRLLPLLVLLMPFASATTAQQREFRGAWIATVANIDWPARGAGATAQKQALVGILDRLRATGVNAVFFQVRSESDAMYRSDIEPWSYWLTGVQGQDPGFDPLAFAIHEAHKRGMELHAWMNPYQVERNLSGAYTTAPNHLSRTHPEWTMVVGNKRVLNPGLPAVSQHVGRVVADVVRRYDVDGVHFDDYFYFEGTTNQDLATYTAYLGTGGTMELADWRRNNVNRMVALVNDSVRSARPSAKFGISPTGIRRSSDANTRGYESYSAV